RLLQQDCDGSMGTVGSFEEFTSDSVCSAARLSRLCNRRSTGKTGWHNRGLVARSLATDSPQRRKERKVDKTQILSLRLCVFAVQFSLFQHSHENIFRSCALQHFFAKSDGVRERTRHADLAFVCNRETGVASKTQRSASVYRFGPCQSASVIFQDEEI